MMAIDNEQDDDEQVLKDMNVTPNGDPTILQIKKHGNESTKAGNIREQDLMNEEKKSETESILYIPQVTQFEALISALMGVDTIYFKWRKVE